MILIMDRIFDLMEMIFRKGLSVITVIELFGYSLPFMIALAVPMAVLVGTLVAFGRLSQDFEVFAMKASGFSMWQILQSSLGFALFWFVVMVAFNNTVLPEANHRLKNLMIDISMKRPSQIIEERVFNKIDPFLIYVEQKNERTGDLKNIMIQEKLKDGVKTIFAKYGKMYSVNGEDLVFELQDGEIHEAIGPTRETYRRIKFKHHRLVVEMNTKLVRRNRAFRSDREMSARMLLKKANELKKDLKKTPTDQKLRIEILQRRINQYLVEFHKKFSIPFASIAFVLLGVPLAIRSRRGGYGTAFGLAFIIFMFYYILLIGGEELGDRTIVPAWSVWIPNILLGLTGIILIVKEK